MDPFLKQRLQKKLDAVLDKDTGEFSLRALCVLDDLLSEAKMQLHSKEAKVSAREILDRLEIAEEIIKNKGIAPVEQKEEQV